MSDADKIPLRRFGKSYYFKCPPFIRAKLGLKERDLFDVDTQGRQIILTPTGDSETVRTEITEKMQDSGDTALATNEGLLRKFARQEGKDEDYYVNLFKKAQEEKEAEN